MKPWPALFAFLVCTGCEPPVTSTFVDGTVAGVSIPGASAVNLVDRNFLGTSRTTVWLGTNLQCRDFDLRESGVNFGATPRVKPDGSRTPMLIVQSGSTLFDTGRGKERLTGATNRFETFSQDDDGTLTGRFSATFATRDGGADGGETFSGDFIATKCEAPSAGCEVAPIGTLGVVALLIWLRRSTLPCRVKRPA